MNGTVLEILQASWSVGMQSGSTNPCSDRIISIELTPAVAPIRMFCDATIVISGIKGSATSGSEIDGSTTSGYQINGTVSNGGFGTAAGWSRSLGELTLTMYSDLSVGQTYTFEFIVRNAPTENAAQNVTFAHPSIFDPDASASVVSGIMQILALEMTVSQAASCAPCWLAPCPALFSHHALHNFPPVSLVRLCRVSSKETVAISSPPPSVPSLHLCICFVSSVLPTSLSRPSRLSVSFLCPFHESLILQPSCHN